MKPMRIVIDPGHGGKDPGASYKGLHEKDVVLEVAKKTKSILDHLDIWMTRQDDTYIPLSKRVEFANESKADFFLSIHANADPDPDLPGMPEAKGEEIWIWKDDRDSKMYSLIMMRYIDMMFPAERFRGIKETDNFYVLNPKHIKMPACLVEIGFIDNSNTWREFQNPNVIREIACCLSLGLMKIERLRLQERD